jgi:hypothetical protein
MTHDEKKKIYSALAAPFPEEAIERTDGRTTGKGYSTTGIKYQYVANRLNEVLGVGGWRAHRTVTVKEIVRSNGRPAFEAIADVTLELGEWIDGNFVVFAESLADGGHVASSEADARKGAYTGAWKKAAGMFGCGRQAYEGSLDDDNLPVEQIGDGFTASTLPSPPASRPAQSPVHKPTIAAPAPPSNARNRLTTRQIGAIWALGRKTGYDQGQLRAFIKQTFGTQPEFLSRDQASQVIGTLTAKAGNGHDHGEPEMPTQEG